MIKSKKTMVLKIQRLAGILNFLCHGIYVGRPFTRRFHRKGLGLKQHHHVKVDFEMRLDCAVWIQFLNDQSAVSRPFIDFTKNTVLGHEIEFYSDAMRGEFLGFGEILSESLGIRSMARGIYS